MDSSDIERISKALGNETPLLIFEAIARNKEMTSSTIVTYAGSRQRRFRITLKSCRMQG